VICHKLYYWETLGHDSSEEPNRLMTRSVMQAPTMLNAMVPII
jgi:hypothetical protein